MFSRFGFSLAVAFASVVIARADDETGFTPLFDGKTLAGWEGNEKIFRVDDGSIVGGTMKGNVPHNDFLATKKDYADFELRVKFKFLGKGANGGVQIRSRRLPNDFEMIGYQADLGDGYWGSLYDESRRKKTLIGPKAEDVEKVLKRDDWNDYTILCDGRRIQLWLNGLQTVDYTEGDETLEQTGLIGLQIHGGGPSETWYKDIRIKELKKEKK